MKDAVQRARLLRSAAIVAALVLVIPIGDALAGTGGRPVDDGAARIGLDASEVIGDGADFQGVLERAEQASEAADAQLPEAFEREVGLPFPHRDVRVDEGGCIVGCVADMGVEEVMAAIRAGMAGKGWSEVALGGLEGSTFVKDGGSCSWALVTCTQAGSATSVVYRCVYR